MPGSGGTRVRFGDFELDLQTGELSQGEARVLLQQQPFKILVLLVSASGKLVTQEEIRNKLWPNDTIVEFESSIATAIKKLRKDLGDSAQNPTYIQTLPGRGYRLLPTVVWLQPSASSPRARQLFKADAGAAAQVVIGRRVSHYRVLDIIGGGGMGIVYRAEDLRLGRPVALKFLPEELATDPVALERFRREARAASQLNHPNICTIYEVAEQAGMPFFSMELLEGENLRDRLLKAEHAPLPLEETLNLARQIISGLEAAHEKGIIHRDIKPANLFVTKKSALKILDFGLAKLVESEEDETAKAAAAQMPASENLVAQGLTRTGQALGTEGYMSPEQVRGEKLDCRTDLFSFGLVLYEMVTGERAFAGNTVPDVHDAIVSREARPARQLNPKLPAKVEQIVTKALMKDRELRYQSAANIATELDALSRSSTPGWPLWGVAAILTIIAIFAVWLFSQIRPSHAALDLHEQQLTSNFPDNPVRAGAISPDGVHLAFSDLKGMHIKDVNSGTILDLPEPQGVERANLWLVPQWFPDGSAVLATSTPPPERYSAAQHSSIWKFPRDGAPPTLLQDDADYPAFSPDASWIAFGRNPGRFGDREIWKMKPDGMEARLLVRSDSDAAMLQPLFLGNGDRLVYLKVDANSAAFQTRELKTGSITTPTTFNLQDESSGFVIPDGRILYTQLDRSSNDYSCNIWLMRVDVYSGQVIESPHKLTNWTGFCQDLQNVTADGKRLLYLRWTGEASIYAADLAPDGTRLGNTQRVTPGNRYAVSAWTADSDAFIYVAKNNGEFGIFRQRLKGGAAERVDSFAYEDFLDEIDKTRPRLTPDGASIVYSVVDTRVPLSNRSQVFRVPVNGGKSELLFAGDFYGPPDCAPAPSDLCLIAERSADLKQLSFLVFDPARGLRERIANVALNPGAISRWRISPDGERIAIVNNTDAYIDLLSIPNGTVQRIAVAKFRGFDSVNWAPGGDALYISTLVQDGSVLLHVDLNGRAQAIWKEQGGLGTAGIPSPDGKHLAIQSWTVNTNLWMIDLPNMH